MTDVLREGQSGWVILPETPFYLEAGGQVSDGGRIHGATGEAVVDSMRRIPVRRDFPRAHHVRVVRGELRTRDIVTAEVDVDARNATRRNHTATHLLHAALRQVLGPHVKQAGSLVAPDRLRFDFVHFQAVARDDLDRIERIVNEQVYRNTPVKTDVDASQDSDCRRRDGAVRRKVRRQGPRRQRAGLQHGALRRHARVARPAISASSRSSRKAASRPACAGSKP